MLQIQIKALNPNHKSYKAWWMVSPPSVVGQRLNSKAVLLAAKEAVTSAKSVADEQANTAIFALGVGRYVDHGLVSPLVSATLTDVFLICRMATQLENGMSYCHAVPRLCA